MCRSILECIGLTKKNRSLDKTAVTVYIYTVFNYSTLRINSNSNSTKAMSKELTDRQSMIFEYICEYHTIHECCPSLAEIATYFGFSSANASRCHLEHIAKKGYITLIPKMARGIKINRSYAQEMVGSIPILGRIAAGVPLLAQETCDDLLPVPPCLFGNGEIFALRVTGDSMINAGILNGDVAIITKQPDVENGEIAAVLIENDATLKRVIKQKTKMILRAENPNYNDIEIFSSDNREVSIIGRYQGLIRANQSGGEL